MFQQEEFATALKKEWRSRLTLMQPTVTNTGGLARRPKNLGGAAPWLVAVLRGAAWGEESAETLLNEMAEEVDARLEEDAIAAADAVAGRRSVAQHPCRCPPRRRLKLTGVLVVQRGQVRRSMHQDCLLKPRNFVSYPFFTHFSPFFAHFQRLDARNPENTARSPGENVKKSRKFGENGGN